LDFDGAYCVRDGVKTRRLGVILKEGRLRAGMTERDMALMMRRSTTYVRAYESGKASLTIEDLETAASAIGASLSDLIAQYEGGSP
jgi:transcriptional regulator with XRE-family HTH domain